MTKYNKARLCVGGVSSVGAVIFAALSGYYYHRTFCTSIGMGALITGPLMISFGLLGISCGILAAAYLGTEFSKCSKRTGNLVIGGATGATALASIGCAAYIMLKLAQNGDGLEIPLPVLGSLLLIGIIFAVLSTYHLTKAPSNDNKQAPEVPGAITQVSKVSSAVTGDNSIPV